jgi:hypothetical protein
VVEELAWGGGGNNILNSGRRNFNTQIKLKPTPVTARSKTWVCARSLTGTVNSISSGGVVVECCVLSSSGLCVGLITRPEVSYRVWCV